MAGDAGGDDASLQADWASDILSFWFGELTPKDWFTQSDAVDAAIVHRYRAIHEFVAGRAVDLLTGTADTARAAIIVLDQFPRNMFRAGPRAFATDAKALEIAKFVVASGSDAGLGVDARLFVYLPYMHSEALDDQDASVALFSALGHAEYLDFAARHRDVVARFGRFPHRNAALGRPSTAAEQAFIAENGRGF